MYKMKSQIKTFIRVFSLGITAVVLPVALISGIVKADENTRKTGFSDRQAVFEIKRQADNALTLSAMGNDITISADVCNAIDTSAEAAKTAVPHYLSMPAEVIEMTVDRLLEYAFQGY